MWWRTFSPHVIPEASQQVLEVTPGELAWHPLPWKLLEASALLPLPVCAPAQCVLFCFQGQEQDVSRIIQALNECLAALPRQLLQEVCGIGVSGQMHGVMFWKTDQGTLGSGDDHMLLAITVG